MGKLVYGVGIHDEGEYKITENGAPTKAYQAWRNMIERCYSSDYHKRHPTYIGCAVHPDWFSFQSFAEWYYLNHPTGNDYHLDKDLKVLGNRTYSPGTCLFVSQVVNKFFSDQARSRGRYLIGTCWHRRSGKFMAQCSNPLEKKNDYLGLFTDQISAHLAWRKRKSDLAYELAMKQANPEVRDALLRWKVALDNNEIHAV